MPLNAISTRFAQIRVPRLIQKILNKYWWALGIALIGAFHLSTLEVPPPSYDDGLTSLFATYGDLTCWKLIVPRVHQIFFPLYREGLMPGYTLVLKTMLKIFGIGVWQSRIGNVAAHLAGITLLMFVILRLKITRWAVVALAMFTMSHFFFVNIRCARVEGPLFLIMAMNLGWLLGQKGRAIGWMAGLSAGTGFILHNSILFFWLSFFLLILFYEGRSVFKSPRCWWWFIGFLSGCAVSLFSVDIENGVRFAQMAKGTLIVSPPIFHWGWNQLAILFHGLDLIVFRGGHGFFPNNLLMGLMLFTLIWQARHFQLFTKVENSLFIFILSFLLLFVWFSPHFNSMYLLYIYPWMFVQAAVALQKNFSRPAGLDKIDLILFGAAQLAVFTPPGQHQLSLIGLVMAGGFALRWIVRSGAQLKKRPRTALALFLLSLLILVVKYEAGMALSIQLVYYLAKKPVEAALILGLPWLIFPVRFWRTRSEEQRRRIQKLILGLYVSAVSAAYVGTNAVRISNLIRTSRTDVRALETFSSTLTHERRLLAPCYLWLYQPSLFLQCESGFRMAELAGVPFDKIDALLAFRPTRIIMDSEPAFKIFSAAKKNGRVQISIEKNGNLPLNDWVEFKIARRVGASRRP